MLFSVAIWIQAQAVRTAEDVRWNAAAVLITSSESADPCFLNGTGRSHHDPMMGGRQAMTSVRGKVPSHVVYMPFFSDTTRQRHHDESGPENKRVTHLRNATFWKFLHQGTWCCRYVDQQGRFWKRLETS